MANCARDLSLLFPVLPGVGADRAVSGLAFSLRDIAFDLRHDYQFYRFSKLDLHGQDSLPCYFKYIITGKQNDEL